MIYEFKSRATGSVIMTKPVAEWILQIVGKTPGATGIITVDQMPGAIAGLRKAIDEEKQALRAEAEAGAPAEGEPGAEDETYPVSLAQRAFPFIEMLEAAHKAGKDVTWGV
ncbi:MAG: DUF1840 domain-containing protein [Burkholderiales bacterium]|nr:MAG: DUF1840 domain-containing protein [Burkholderiales bacterium]